MHDRIDLIFEYLGRTAWFFLGGLFQVNVDGLLERGYRGVQMARSLRSSRLDFIFRPAGFGSRDGGAAILSRLAFTPSS